MNMNVMVETPALPRLVIDGQEMIDGQDYKLVVHGHPDTDALCCLWAAAKFVAEARGSKWIPVFIDAGAKLPAKEADGYNVICMDTGLGQLDQHGKSLKGASSFMLAVEAFGLSHDRALDPLVQLTRFSDNVAALNLTSVHFVFRGLARACSDTLGVVDWEGVLDYAFIALNIIYGQSAERLRSAADWKKFGRIQFLRRSEINVAFLGCRSYLREEAFNAGADVVVFFNKKKETIRTVVVQAGRGSHVTLDKVAGAIRTAEAKKRTIALSAAAAEGIGQIDVLPGFFLHDSLKLFGLGTRTAPVLPGQETRLSQCEIERAVFTALLEHPRRLQRSKR